MYCTFDILFSKSGGLNGQSASHENAPIIRVDYVIAFDFSCVASGSFIDVPISRDQSISFFFSASNFATCFGRCSYKEGRCFM